MDVRHWILQLLIVLALAPAAAMAQTKIGYVDWKRLVESAPQKSKDESFAEAVVKTRKKRNVSRAKPSALMKSKW